MIILSLQYRTSHALRRAILSAPEKADLVEVRLDGLLSVTYPQLKALFRGAPRPLIASCRRRSDGGVYAGSEQSRVRLLADAVRAGARYVDVEMGSAAVSLASRFSAGSAGGIIVSHHDKNRLPDRLAALYRRMARVQGARAVKIVGVARKPSDVLRVRDLLAKHASADPPLVSFCMGQVGVASRILCGAWGSWATYVSSRAGKETAPGQMSLSDVLGLYRIEEIDSDTHLTGIIGRPLGHSLSPVIHNAGYAADRLSFRFLPFDWPGTALKDLRTMIRKLHIRGLAVTSPYKTAVMKHLDRIEPLAKRIGAVNTIVYDGRHLVGLNTDATAGFSALDDALKAQGTSAKGLTVAIVGSGGAARALAHAVSRAGSNVIIASRSRPRGERLARSIGARYVLLRNLSRQRYDVLINCTPLGMKGTDESESLPDAAIKGRLVYDVVYRPERTTLLRKARRKGIPTLGGLKMFLGQAAEQYSLFTGRDAPLEAMRAAARLELSGGRRDW